MGRCMSMAEILFALLILGLLIWLATKSGWG